MKLRSSLTQRRSLQDEPTTDQDKITPWIWMDFNYSDPIEEGEVERDNHHREPLGHWRACLGGGPWGKARRSRAEMGRDFLRWMGTRSSLGDVAATCLRRGQQGWGGEGRRRCLGCGGGWPRLIVWYARCHWLFDPSCRRQFFPVRSEGARLQIRVAGRITRAE
jgi:hypothetical protein